MWEDDPDLRLTDNNENNDEDELNSEDSNQAVAIDEDQHVSELEPSDDEIDQTPSLNNNPNSEDFRYEWTETIVIPSNFNPINNPFRYQSPKPIRFKGAEWSVLLIAKRSTPDNPGVGVFLGYDSSENLPKNFRLCLKTTYALSSESYPGYSMESKFIHVFKIFCCY
jgi:hypothetical protein